MSNLPYLLSSSRLEQLATTKSKGYAEAQPFPHVVIDDFLEPDHAQFLSDHFPAPDHPVWLDWRVRSAHQYGKLGVGNSSRFELLDGHFYCALNEFNSGKFLTFIEQLTGLNKLLPDPYFTGGALHQIVNGGILDIHTDFNLYKRLGIFRQINAILYLTKEWKPGYGGELQLWDGDGKTGKCVASIPPLFNRLVVFNTNKKSFHGHPNEWTAPEWTPRRSIALYCYSAEPQQDGVYDEVTDFQGVVSKELPAQS